MIIKSNVCRVASVCLGAASWLAGPMAHALLPPAPAHGATRTMISRWQRAYESTRAKVVDESIRWAWAPDGSSVVFERTVDGRRGLFRCTTSDGRTTPVLAGPPCDAGWEEIRVDADGSVRIRRGKQWLRAAPDAASLKPCKPPAAKPKKKEAKPPAAKAWQSPDGQWKLEIRDHDLWLRSLRKKNAAPARLTEHGDAAHPWNGPPVWAPDSRHFAIWRIAKPAKLRKVRLIEAAPKDRLQPEFRDIDYPKPGDKIPVRAPWVFAVDGGAPVAPDPKLVGNPFSTKNLAWRGDSRRLTWEVVERGFGSIKVIETDVASRRQRVLVDESSDTFVFVSGKTFRRDIADGREIVWMSERDGWNHLYLLDGRDGSVKRQLTRGKWVVRKVLDVDEEKREILLAVSGIIPGQDPYFIQYARVGIDDAKFTLLTRSNGNHAQIDRSPDGRYFVCRWSRADHPPVHELRRWSDGKLIRTLAEADASALLATGWQMPQPFVAKDREGKFDIWGVIVRPPDFDPSKKYPVIEDIYAGPQGSFVPKSWHLWWRNMRELAMEGFIVVKIDGRGTSNRCREFHHFCYKNLKDAGFPDRIAWMKAAAQKAEPSMDLARVGIFGGSAGGQNALGALLFHGDFYKAAAADCGCHDNRMDKLWWNEQWMDYPVGPEYAENSNVTHAANLKGALLLTVGALDSNVDPSSTMQVAQALISAEKEFEIMVFPESNHGAGESNYGRVMRARFFKRHLGGPQK
jgi:dipeptidyl aminopeptidase/acylaminoacyl peptidase